MQLDDFVPVQDADPDAAGGASQDVTDDDEGLGNEEEEGEDLLENMHKCVASGSGSLAAAQRIT